MALADIPGWSAVIGTFDDDPTAAEAAAAALGVVGDHGFDATEIVLGDLPLGLDAFYNEASGSHLIVLIGGLAMGGEPDVATELSEVLDAELPGLERIVYDCARRCGADELLLTRAAAGWADGSLAVALPAHAEVVTGFLAEALPIYARVLTRGIVPAPSHRLWESRQWSSDDDCGDADILPMPLPRRPKDDGEA